MDKVYQLYGGTVELSFNPDVHSYEVVDEFGDMFAVPSVTEILKIVGKGDGLTQWSSNMAVDKIRASWLADTPYPQLDIDSALKDAKFAWKAERGKAADIGTMAHDWIERYIRGEMPSFPEDERAKKCCQAAQEWMMNHHFEVADEPERRIYSRKYKYAGTLDWPCIVDGKLSIVDWKSSKSIWPSFALQLAAYQQAWEEMTGQRVYNRYIVRLGKADGAFDPRKLTRATFKKDLKAFLCAKGLYERITQLDRELKGAGGKRKRPDVQPTVV